MAIHVRRCSSVEEKNTRKSISPYSRHTRTKFHPKKPDSSAKSNNTQMAEQPSTENYIRKNTSKQFSTRGSMLNAYLIFASLCALTGTHYLRDLATSSQRGTHHSNRHSSSPISTARSTALYMPSRIPAAAGLVRPVLSSQCRDGDWPTSIPGQCVTVTDSCNLLG